MQVIQSVCVVILIKGDLEGDVTRRRVRTCRSIAYIS